VGQIHLRLKTNFANLFNPITAVQTCAQKDFTFVISEVNVLSRHPASSKRGVARDRHETRGGVAVAVTALASVLDHADEQGGCGREVVWS